MGQSRQLDETNCLSWIKRSEICLQHDRWFHLASYLKLCTPLTSTEEMTVRYLLVLIVAHSVMLLCPGTQALAFHPSVLIVFVSCDALSASAHKRLHIFCVRVLVRTGFVDLYLGGCVL